MVITDLLKICLNVVDNIACSIFMVAVKIAVCAQNSSFSLSFGCVKLLSASTVNEKISSPPGLDESSFQCFNDVVTNRRGSWKLKGRMITYKIIQINCMA